MEHKLRDALLLVALTGLLVLPSLYARGQNLDEFVKPDDGVLKQQLSPIQYAVTRKTKPNRPTATASGT